MLMNAHSIITVDSRLSMAEVSELSKVAYRFAMKFHAEPHEDEAGNMLTRVTMQMYPDTPLERVLDVELYLLAMAQGRSIQGTADALLERLRVHHNVDTSLSPADQPGVGEGGTL